VKPDKEAVEAKNIITKKVYKKLESRFEKKKSFFLEIDN